MTLNPTLVMNEQETMRARIMNQAASLFVTRGFAGISMREIAEAVGVSKAGLYYYFKDKEDLFIDILKDNLEEIERIVTKAYQSSPDTFSRLRNMTIWIFQQPLQQRAVIRLASQEMGNINPKVRAEFNNLYHQKFIGQIEAIIQQGMDHREIRPNSPTVVSWILLGMMYPFFYVDPSRDEILAEDISEQIMQVFFNGLGIQK